MSGDASKFGGLSKTSRSRFEMQGKAGAPQATTAASVLDRRTMLAFALGFACVGATAYMAGGDINRAFARDDAGVHEFLMQNAGRGRKPAYQAPVFYTPAYRAPAAYQPQRHDPGGNAHLLG